MSVPLSRAVTAEGLGTFALVVFGPGAAVVQAQTGALGHLGVAAVFGLTVTAVIAALAPISGAHINPAATFALTLAGQFPRTRVLQAFTLELILTFFLLLVALRSGLPWVVGGVVAMEAAMSGPITGASMNPDRSFAPALASGIWTAHWLYWVAPLLGAALAITVNHLLAPTAPVEPQPQQAQEFAPDGALAT